MLLHDLCYCFKLDGQVISPDNPRFAQLVDLFSSIEDTLSQSLSGDEQKLLMQLTDAHDEMIAIVNLDSFVEGFRLGSKVVSESVSLER